MGRRRRSPPPVTKRAKGDKRARTRAQLIDAAAAVIGEKGFERSSLEEIAAKAGMTRGAIYGNFRDKEEIFLAVAASRWMPVSPADPRQGETPAARLRRYGEAVAEAAASRKRESAGAASFVAHALTHEPLRAMLQQANVQIYRAAATRIRRAQPGLSESAAADLAKIIHALSEGFVVLHALMPEIIPREIIVRGFEMLGAGSASARGDSGRLAARERRAE